MSKIALELAKQLLNPPDGIDTANLYIDITYNGDLGMSISYKYKDKQVNPPDLMDEDPIKGKGGTLVSGVLDMEPAKRNLNRTKGQCHDAFIIEYVTVRPKGGWGRLLYYIAMHFSKDKGITGDRLKSSSDAVSVWNKLRSDAEVQKKPLDDYMIKMTPDEKDDCNMSSTGVYGYKYAKDEETLEPHERHSMHSYHWNPMLSYGDERKVHIYNMPSEKERLEKGEKYRKEMASALAYVYVGSSIEAIKLLSDNGRLAINGSFPRKSPEVSISRLDQQKIPKVINPIKEDKVKIYNLIYK